MTVADQPAASSSRCGIRRLVEIRSSESAAASSQGIQASQGMKP
ncbi:MAG: hypothetical protein ACM34O_06535 [Ignavibacteria bacterium]